MERRLGFKTVIYASQSLWIYRTIDDLAVIFCVLPRKSVYGNSDESLPTHFSNHLWKMNESF